MSFLRIMLCLCLCLFVARSSSLHAHVCTSCCTPSDFFVALPEYIVIPFVIVVIGAFLLWLLFLNPKIIIKREVEFDEKMSYEGNIPFAGEFTYNCFKLEVEDVGEWGEKSECKVKIVDSSALEFQDVHVPYFNLQPNFNAKIENHSKFIVERINKFYLTEVPGSEKPGFISDRLLMLPDDCNVRPEVIFPKTISILLFCFSIILVLIVASIVIFTQTNEGFFYSSIYLSYVLGYPWGTFTSLLGILAFLVYWNPLGIGFLRLKREREEKIFILLLAIAIVCITFSVFDFIAAGFIEDRTLIDTRGEYTLNHTAEFAENCEFSKYDCSVTFEESLTKQDDSCQDGYVMQCFSYNLGTKEYCSEEINKFVTLFVFQGIIELLLSALWAFLVLQRVNLGAIYWESVQKKLLEINKMRSYVEIKN